MIRSPFRSAIASLSAAILVISTAGCVRHTPGSEATTVSLVETEWRLIELNSAPSIDPEGDSKPYMRFLTEGSRLTGSTGCNNFNGQFTQDGTGLRVGPLAMTRRACLDQELNVQEQKFAAALEAMTRYTISEGTLTIYSPDGRLARFREVAE